MSDRRKCSYMIVSENEEPEIKKLEGEHLEKLLIEKRSPVKIFFKATVLCMQVLVT